MKKIMHTIHQYQHNVITAYVANNPGRSYKIYQLDDLTNAANIWQSDAPNLIICGLNKTSLLFAIYKIYQLYKKLCHSTKTDNQQIIFTNIQYLLPNHRTSYECIYAKYFMFLPWKISSQTIERNIEFIGQRWFARFAISYIVVFKKI